MLASFYVSVLLLTLSSVIDGETLTFFKFHVILYKPTGYIKKSFMQRDLLVICFLLKIPISVLLYQDVTLFSFQKLLGFPSV